MKINLFSMYKNSDPTFLKRQFVSNAKTKHLMLFRDTSAYILRINWNTQIYCVGDFRATERCM